HGDDEFYRELASAMCSYAVACEAKYEDASAFQANCVPEFVREVIRRNAPSGPGVLDDESVRACIDAWQTRTCDESLDTTQPKPCRELFANAEQGEVCGGDFECFDGPCVQPSNQCADAVCAELAGSGASCTSNDQCVAGLMCIGALSRT